MIIHTKEQGRIKILMRHFQNGCTPMANRAVAAAGEQHVGLRRVRPQAHAAAGAPARGCDRPEALAMRGARRRSVRQGLTDRAVAAQPAVELALVAIPDY